MNLGSICFLTSQVRIRHYLYGSESGSGSFHPESKKVRKTLISTVLWLLYDFLTLKNDDNVPTFKKDGT
jgi:hypothetical protein